MPRVRLRTLLGRLPSPQKAGKIILPKKGKGSYRRDKKVADLAASYKGY